MLNLQKLRKVNLNIIILLILFLLCWMGFWFFEDLFIFKIILSILGLSFIYFAVTLKNWQFLVYLALYLNIYNLYFIYENLGWYLSLVMILAIISMAMINWLFFNFKSILETLEQKLFYCSLLTLIDLEIFLTMISWPTSMKTKGIILIAINYFLWGVLENYQRKRLSIKTIAPYIITSSVAIILSIVTTLWYTY